MGMLNEMFGDEKDYVSSSDDILLAKGTYKSDSETILNGYKIFQKKYVYKNLFFKLFVVLIAIISSVMMILTSEHGEIMPYFCMLLCICALVYFVSEPINNKKKLKSSLEILQGTDYEAQIFSDKVIISTINNENVENNQNDNDISDDDNDTDNENIPSTVIHLDSHMVDFIDRSDMFIVCVKKSYAFIIPKTAFSEDEINTVKEKMKLILGVRYKSA